MDFICFINIFFRYGKKLLESMLAPYEMNMQELIVLLVIHESPGIYQSKLINYIGLDKGNFSKLLKNLNQINSYIPAFQIFDLYGKKQITQKKSKVHKDMLITKEPNFHER